MDNEIKEKLLDLYPNIDALNLPNWVKEQASEAYVIDSQKQTILLPNGEKYQLNNTLNHLSGSEWTYFINSVVNTKYSTKGSDSYAFNIRKIHPTPKPPQLMAEIIKFFTKENEVVFDYFMGVGGTLLGASLTNRIGYGVDLNAKYIDAYKKASKFLNLTEHNCVNADAVEFLSNPHNLSSLLSGKKISLVLLDPPYFNMMSKKKTGADMSIYGNNATPFTESPLDLGNMNKDDFLNNLKLSVEKTLPFVKKRGHIVIFIKDMQPNKKSLNLLHNEIIEKLNEINNIYYKGLKIWADQTSKLFPYGYPFSFVANQIHQYILIFRKEF
ncbi:MAG: DNA methyltransferase [Candidatus Gastranaerophilales bacterium]